MKKFLVIFLNFIFNFIYSIIKNSTKRIDDEIFQLKKILEV